MPSLTQVRKQIDRIRPQEPIIFKTVYYDDWPECQEPGTVGKIFTYHPDGRTTIEIANDIFGENDYVIT